MLSKVWWKSVEIVGRHGGRVLADHGTELAQLVLHDVAA